MSKWTNHKATWSNCDKCVFSSFRKKVVLYKGTIPCDVLFVGEAPGVSEDALGKPFVGPAGSLLEEIIAAALNPRVTIGHTNVLGCIPKDAEGVKIKKSSDFPESCLDSCSPRLQEIIEIAEPELIVAVGDLAKTTLLERRDLEAVIPCEVVSIYHPSFLLRQPPNMQPLKVQETVITIRDAYNELVTPF